MRWCRLPEMPRPLAPTVVARLRRRDGRPLPDVLLAVGARTAVLDLLDDGGWRTFHRTSDSDDDGVVTFAEHSQATEPPSAA